MVPDLKQAAALAFPQVGDRSYRAPSRGPSPTLLEISRKLGSFPGNSYGCPLIEGDAC